MILAFLLAACVRKEASPQPGEFRDEYSLSGAQGGQVGMNEAVEPDPEFKINDQFNHSSLPVGIKVGTRIKSFDDVPHAALPPQSVYQVRRIGRCTYGIRSGLYEMSRYYYAGEKWVPVDAEIASNAVIKMDIGEHLYMSFSAPLYIHIAKNSFAECVKVLRGHRRSIGRFSLAPTVVDLLPAIESPPKKIDKMTTDEARPISLFIRWLVKDPYPVAEDAEGIPFHINSPIYHTQFTHKGFYYVSVRPQLEYVP